VDDVLFANAREGYARSYYNVECHAYAYKRLEEKNKKAEKHSDILFYATIILLIANIIILQYGIEFLLNKIFLIGLVLTATDLIVKWREKNDYKQQMTNQKIYIEKYQGLRDAYKILIEKIKSSSISNKQSRCELDKLSEVLSETRKGSPAVMGEDKTKASKALKLKGTDWTDELINSLLPEQFHVKQGLSNTIDTKSTNMEGKDESTNAMENENIRQ
jgi:hypothetical protein